MNLSIGNLNENDAKVVVKNVDISHYAFQLDGKVLAVTNSVNGIRIDTYADFTEYYKVASRISWIISDEKAEKRIKTLVKEEESNHKGKLKVSIDVVEKGIRKIMGVFHFKPFSLICEREEWKQQWKSLTAEEFEEVIYRLNYKEKYEKVS